MIGVSTLNAAGVRPWRVVALVVLLCRVLNPGSAIAQEDPEPPDPRIALVLSGGAAKGFAHVGVLKVLEEMRVPVHLITATSMGSIMGGLYAAGMSPEGIEDAMADVDWTGLFRDKPPREDLDYRQKEDDVRYLFDLGLGVRFDGEVIIPTGVLGGQKIGLLLREHTLHVSDVRDFDDLPIPYRAVAADIETGEAYVIDHGDLARAMRASMGIPGAFAPVEIDDRLLVDGGVADNMPVDLARALGADVVIAVDVSSPMRTREQLDNVLGIVGQLTSMLSRLNVEEQIPRADILLDPELGDLGGSDYARSRELVDIGEAEARRHAAELARYSISEADYAAYRSRYRVAPSEPEWVIDFVEIEGNDRVDRRVIESRIRTRPGDTLDPSRVEQDVAAVFGLGDFSSVDWELADRGDRRGVVIRVREKPWGPNFVNMGALFDVDGKFTGRVGLVLTRLNARGAELRNDIQIGAIQSLESKFYQPLEFSGTIFVVPGILLQNDDQSIFDEEGGEIAVYAVNRRLATLEAGVHLGRLGELRGGIARGSASAEVEVGSADLPDVDVDVGGFLGRIIVDRLDSASFPNRGYIAGTEVFLSRRGLGADDSYDRIEVAASRFWPQGRNIWLLGGQLGGSLGSELPPYHQFTLGGFLSLSGLERGQLRGPYAGVLRGGLLHRLADGAAPILKGVYLGALVEAGNVWEHSGEIGEAPILSATGLLGVDTALGPLYFAYGVADTGQDELYVSLGQTF